MMRIPGGFSFKMELLIVLLLEIFIGTSALKDVSVIIPLAVKIMDTVTLQCKYNLEGEPLYTVKWYKGPKEFYRYIPKELPDTQIFNVPGVYVDLSKSTPNKVVLRDVTTEVTGKYKCEVSSDAPNFYTLVKSGYMYVVDVPQDDPILSIEKGLLEIGYTLRGNCSSPPSFPSANITWLLNGKKISESFQRHVQVPTPPSSPSVASAMGVPSEVVPHHHRRHPTITVSGVELEIDRDTFVGGKAKITCVVSLFDLYSKEEVRVLYEERPKPRPSSVLGTRDTATAGAPILATSIAVIALFSVLFLR